MSSKAERHHNDCTTDLESAITPNDTLDQGIPCTPHSVVDSNSPLTGLRIDDSEVSKPSDMAPQNASPKLTVRSGSVKRRIGHKLIVLAISLLAYTGFLLYLLLSLPSFTSISSSESISEIEAIAGYQMHMPFELKFPSSVEDLKQLRLVLDFYQKECSIQVEVIIIALLLFLQIFVIPGSLFLNILAGSMYDFYHAITLVQVVNTVGAVMCYGISHALLRDVILVSFPERCEAMKRQVQRNRHHLLNYIIFLRILPFVPNWFVNLASPIVGVPFRPFLLGTFLGFLPSSILSVKAGQILSELRSTSDLYDWETVFVLFLMAALSIAPIVAKSFCQR